MEVLERHAACAVGFVDATAGRGLVAKRSLAAGDAVVVVPWESIFDLRAAMDALRRDAESSFPLLRGAATGADPALLIDDALTSVGGATVHLARAATLACGLLAALRNPKGRWAWYARSLPCRAGYARVRDAQRRAKRLGGRKHEAEDDDEQLNLNVDCLERSEKDLWAHADVGLARLLRVERWWFRRAFDALFDGAASVESWMWASVVVRSRSIGIPDDGAPFPSAGALADAVRGDGPKPRGFALVPFLDFANHDDAEDNAKLCQFDDAAGGVGLVATRPVAEGNEIRFNYRPDEHLRGFYRSYGFVPARPPRQIYDVDEADDAEAADRRVAARRWPPKGAVTVLDVDARPPGVAAAARTCEDRGSRVVVRRADAAAGGGDDAAARARAVALLRLALRAARREPGGGDAADAYRAASAAILEEALADLVRVERVRVDVG